MSQARSGMRPFDQSRNIGNDDSFQIRQLQGSNHWREGGEGIFPNLGMGRRQAPDQGGFPGIGKSHQSHLGNYFQLHKKLPLLSRLAGLCKFRRPALRGFESGIAFAALSAPGANKFLSRPGQVTQHLSGLFVPDHRPRWNQANHITAPGAAFVLALSVHAPAGLIVGLSMQTDKGRFPPGHTENDMAAIAAVTPVGTSLGNKLLPTETDTAPATVTTLYLDLHSINKHRLRLPDSMAQWKDSPFIYMGDR